MSVESSIERAEKAVSEGKHWRAKEILQGRISSHPFEPRVCEALGKVLLAMNDHLEAGRYLFISGARSPEYEEAISIYLERFANSSATQFHSTLPSKIRAVPVEDYPAGVVEELERRGLLKSSLGNAINSRRQPATASKFWQWTATAIGIAIVCLILIGLINGVVVVMRWIF